MISIRPSTAEDSASIERVEQLATADLRRIYVPLPAAMQARKQFQNGPKVVAVLNGKIVGSSSWYPTEQAVHILGLSVDPDFRKRGIARSILNYIEILCEAQDKACARLYTVEQTGNVPIFERCGYKVIEQFPSEIFVGIDGSQVIEILMEKRLREKG